MKIYLASPYSSNDKLEMVERFTKITYYAGQLIKQGYLVYSPITHSKPIADLVDLPHNFEYWRALDESMIDWADAVVVLCLPGYLNSSGVKSELTYAYKTKKKVIFKDFYDINFKTFNEDPFNISLYTGRGQNKIVPNNLDFKPYIKVLLNGEIMKV